MEQLKRGIYRHFKGNYYYVEGVVICSETYQKYVLYMGRNGTRFIRPLDEFIEDIHVDREDNHTRQKKRFEYMHGKENNK